MISLQVTGADAVKRRLASIEQQLGRSMESILAQEARAICVSAIFHTNPTGANGEMRMRMKVASDIRRVYLDRDSIYSISELMKPRSMALAMGFYRAAKAGNTAKANKYLREAGFKIEVLDPSLHRKARTGNYGGVAKNHRPETIVRKPSLAKYTREKQATVGTAKAGWYAAAKSLGGRVRTNLTNAAGKRSTAETIPAWVRKVANRTPGLGGSRVTPTRIEIFTNVKHAADALSVEDLDIVIEKGRDSFTAAITKAIIAIIRKPGTRRAA
jgi:hypothetical protein